MECMEEMKYEVRKLDDIIKEMKMDRKVKKVARDRGNQRESLHSRALFSPLNHQSE